MRRSKEDKAASHERIVEIAAARIRESGTEQPGVAEIMRAAGLTHGGFYKHFGSRDELIAEAVERALTDSESRLRDATSRRRRSAGRVRRVLPLGRAPRRPGLRLRRGRPRHGHPARRRAGAGRLPLPGRPLPRPPPVAAGRREDDDTRREATVTLSAMIGALMIARALGPTPRSDEILRDVREAVRERRLG